VTPEKFLALTIPEQLLAIYERLEQRAVTPPGSGSGKAPKFDTVINRGQGKVQFASECSLKELLYWKAQSDKPPKDPKYTESNQKRSRALGYWISYRQASPDEQWRGERNRTTITAAAPSDKPLLYDKDAPTHVEPPSNGAGGGDDDIPFARRNDP
jgi:hypothetical protein